MEGRWTPARRAHARSAWPSKARLHIYLGAIPGAGKTSAMLAEGRRLASLGVDVVVGLAETHAHDGPGQAQDPLERIPGRSAGQGHCARELDVDAVLARRPAVVLVDELAHSNAAGSLREKRWQDVDELLRAGIDVLTTLDIAHLAELQDAVEQITDVSQREFVPEAVVLAADRIDFIDTEPRVALRRLAGRNGRAGQPAVGKLRDLDRLDLLRRLARTWLSEHDPGEARHDPGAGMAAQSGPVVVALLAGTPAGPALHRAAELAALRRAPLVGVYVLDGGGGNARGRQELGRVLAQLGGRYTEIGGADSAWALARFAARVGAGVLVMPDEVRPRGRQLGHGSVARRVLGLAGPVEVCVVPSGTSYPGAALPSRRRVLTLLLAAGGPAALAIGLGVAHLIDGPVAVLLAVVGTAIGALVHALADRVRRATRSQAEADQLARLVACALVGAPLAISEPTLALSSCPPARFALRTRR
jgi:two-component system, OmpR family, sensor histidine kinase KdpD